MADTGRTCKRPWSWDKAVSAAHLRATDHTQEEAAKLAGVGARTLARWEQSPWWPQAMAEALVRWRSGLLAASRKSLAAGVKNDPDLALKIVERLDPELRPPKVHQVNEDLPELDYSLLTLDELDRLESGAVSREEHYRLKVLTEQRAKMQAEGGAT